MDYIFNEEKFKKNFNVNEKKSLDSLRLSHVPDHEFKLFPYKASGKTQSPIVIDLEETVSDFFRMVLGSDVRTINYEELCKTLISELEIDSEDIELFKDIIQSMFFNGESFVAKSLGLYPYQTQSGNKSIERLALFLFSVLGINREDCQKIKVAINNYPYNVLEKMIVEVAENVKEREIRSIEPYFPIIIDVQKKFRDDFYFMLEFGMTSLDDFSNLLAIYYFYYVSQTCIALDQFCQGKRAEPIPLYFALDWEKVSKNRSCCNEGWEKLLSNINHMFCHAITLEIINQHSSSAQMYDYIKLQDYINENPDEDYAIAREIEVAEKVYVSYVGDCNFDEIPYASGGSRTDRAIRHLFKCVEEQFLNTERKRANQFYNEKFMEFCKNRWVKNRRKSGSVLNLTERDIIFLTKISIKDKEKIRLIDLYKEYEYRGIFLDHTSKEYLQEFFTKLNLIDKKSDSGDAQYVKRIL